MADSNHTDPNSTATVFVTEAVDNVDCGGVDTDYDVTQAALCAVCFVFGLLYCFLGTHQQYYCTKLYVSIIVLHVVIANVVSSTTMSIDYHARLLFQVTGCSKPPCS